MPHDRTPRRSPFAPNPHDVAMFLFAAIGLALCVAAVVFINWLSQPAPPLPVPPETPPPSRSLP